MENHYTYEQFLQVHEPQLLAAGLPELYWNSLYNKLINQTLDAGDHFEVIIEESEKDDGAVSAHVKALTELQADNPKNVFLIDHAWTFRPINARSTLHEVQSLRERVMAMLNIKPDDFWGGSASSSYYADQDEEEDPNKAGGSGTNTDVPELNKLDDQQHKSGQQSRIEEYVDQRILDELWTHAQCYSVKVVNAEMDENQIPVWYLPDEFGICIGHSLKPNTKMVPFLYLFQNMAYCLLFPLEHIQPGGIVTRNYVDTQLARKHPDWLEILLHPWQPKDFSDQPIVHVEKSIEHFTSGRLQDLLPTQAENGENNENIRFPNPKSKHESNSTILVFASELQLIGKLQRIKWEETNDPMQADIIWQRSHFHDFRTLANQNPGALINQFPFECVLTVKDLFAATVQTAYEHLNHRPILDEQSLRWTPSWLPLTFNLDLELPRFVAYFYRREQRNLDNTWIVKPWNLARGMDTHVTRNLNAIIRLVESGPKIVSKYIENPALFRRPDNGNNVKFDFRYIVFVRSFENPMDVFLFNQFWIRFAINEFNLRQLDDYFTHVTVHQYGDKADVYEMRCEDFIRELCKQYPRLDWSAVQAKINDVIREVFRAVTTVPPPRGIAPNRQSRAMYGLDLMLHWREDSEVAVELRGAEDVQVAFIEANFMPDCERACQYYEDFADVAFDTMFFDQAHPNRTTRLF